MSWRLSLQRRVDAWGTAALDAYARTINDPRPPPPPPPPPVAPPAPPRQDSFAWLLATTPEPAPAPERPIVVVRSSLTAGTRNQFLLHLKRTNPLRVRRLKHDLAWYEKQARKFGIDKDHARSLL